MVDIVNPESALHQIFSSSSDSAAFAEKYIDHLFQILRKIDVKVFSESISLIEETSQNGGVIYVLGNGGSAATASHIVNDLGIEATGPGGERLKVVSLVDNLASISAVANDYGWDEIFLKQLEPFLTSKDMLVALSVSGNSKNIISAVEFAHQVGAKVVGCTGFDGGRLGELADVHVHAATDKGEYGPVEDMFQIFDHILYSYFKLKRHHNR